MQAEILPDDQRGPFLDAIEEAIGLGTYVWEPGRRVQWSPGFFRLLGLPVAPVDTMIFFDRVHADDRARVVMAWQQVAVTGRVEGAMYRLVPAAGTIRWVVGRGTVVRDAAGEIARVIGTLTDVTDQREAAERLAESNRLLAETQRAGGVGTYVYRLRSGRLDWSDELRRIAGLAPDAPVHRDTALEACHADDRERLIAWGAQLIGSVEVPPFVGRLVRPDGEVRAVEWRARRGVFDGEPAIIGVATDVTERTQLEDRVRHASKMEAVGNLAAGVAHDFNNYLTVLSMQLEAVRLRQGQVADDDVATMADAVGRCAGLVQQLLAFARRQPFRPRRLDLTEQVRGVVRIFERVAAPGVAIDWRDEGSVAVVADPAQVDGAVMNLLVNARDAMPAGGKITVEVARTRLDAGDPRLDGRLPPGEYAMVRVADRGVGIAPEVLPRIFEPYFTTKGGGGVGLGLAAVYGSVHQHGGSIHVESEVGRGSSFEVHLPADDRPAPSATVPPLVEVPPARRILVVEDVEPVREALAELLEEDGLEVDVAEDGAAALALIRGGAAYDVVLSDIVMPRLDGHGLLRALAEEAPAVAVILMTGYTDRFDEHAGEVRLDKPFSRDQLHAAIARAIASKRRG